jgi:hypothetical protein
MRCRYGVMRTSVFGHAGRHYSAEAQCSQRDAGQTRAEIVA